MDRFSGTRDPGLMISKNVMNYLADIGRGHRQVFLTPRLDTINFAIFIS